MYLIIFLITCGVVGGACILIINKKYMHKN
jgi:hypothetical protein